MNRLKRFLRRHYTGVMLAIIVLSIAGSLVMLAFLSASLNQQVKRSNEQIQLLKNLANEISDDQQKQHDHQDARQACFFNLFVSSTNTRKPVTQEDADQCRVAGDEVQEPASTTPDVPATQSQPQPQVQQTTERQDNPNKPENPGQSEERTLLDTILETLANLFRGVR